MNIEDLMSQGFNLITAQRMMRARGGVDSQIKEKVEITKKIEAIENTNLSDIPGIGQATRKTLIENGIRTKEDLIKAGIDGVKEIITSPISLKGIKNFFNEINT